MGTRRGNMSVCIMHAEQLVNAVCISVNMTPNPTGHREDHNNPPI